MLISANYLLFVINCMIVFTSADDSNNSTKVTPLEVKKMLEEKCSKEYSLTCMKLDLAAYVPLLSNHRTYRLLPGLIIESGGYKSKIVGSRLPVEAVEPALDMYLVHGLDSFMDSISLKIKVMDRKIVDKVKDIGFKVFNATSVTSLKEDDQQEARGRKKKLNHALLVGGMVSAGTLLALTMSAISAMAGKALLASILSLALTLMNRNGGGGGGAQGGGGGGGKTTYEIITHSVPHHEHDYNRHTWSAEPATAQEAYQYVKAINPLPHQIHVS
ncbi:hypothetical protein O3M35_012631 [Rhynocoris fuscipes]|uniref:Uncharacterized protein n=1 Tax=Rhynocoris fuscipes TaxID=488301 RepID=A0AAW1CU76_9HEMI